MEILAVDTGEALLLKVILQLMVIIAAARAGGWLFSKLGQPQVVGEIATGLLLGPSLLGRISPDLFHWFFAAETSDILLVIGQLGLVFLMFVIGLEFEFSHLKHLGKTALGVAVSGIALPFALGAGLAWLIHPVVAADYSLPGFVLLIATALSITAIPILGRIMIEFNLSATPLGVLTISAAAVDDVLGWILLAAVSASVRGGFEWWPVLQMILLTVAFVAIVFTVVRPFLVRWLMPHLESKSSGFALLPFSLLLVVILAAAVATNWIGVFSIFGPFVLGAALSGHREFQTAIRGRLEEFTTAFFLPVFFTYTGLRTDVGSLGSGWTAAICLLLIATAVVGKMAGCGLAARLGGMSWRESACVAAMMNTRALMGLIAINIGRELGVIPNSVFSMMVVMAIVTTLMTAPLLKRLLQGADPQRDRRLFLPSQLQSRPVA